ncbi:MAG: hypothetical protein RBR28_12460 [Lentimicrobium sp.]|jgi:hypothetical protein|nr:hypothetical protein [Lentimicrobium sp.]
MKKRFIFECCVGLIMVIAIYFFGVKGLAAITFLAAHPFIGKKESDERENQLFYKVGNYTAGASLLAATLIYYFSDQVISGHLVGNHWFGLLIASFLMAHGVSGLIIFRDADRLG